MPTYDTIPQNFPDQGLFGLRESGGEGEGGGVGLGKLGNKTHKKRKLGNKGKSERKTGE